MQEIPTRDGNVLDLTFSTNPSLIRNLNNIPGLADHEAIIVDSYVRPIFSKKQKKKTYDFRKADWTSLNDFCEKLSTSITKKYEMNFNAIDLWDLFKSTLNLGISQFIPSKFSKKKSSLPWFNKHLEKLIRKKSKLHKKAKASGEWDSYKQHQKHCKKEFIKAENDYVNQIINKGLEEKNTKPFWKYIKAKKIDKIGVSPLKENGQLFSESKKKAEILLKQFKSVFTIDNTSKMPTVNKYIKDSITSIKIDKDGVEKLLSKIKPHKACGPDQIPNMVLKNCAKTLAPGVTLLFQKSLDTGIIPKDWTDANIAPVFKKGDKHAPENYRPVSLTSVISKTLEHIICHHLHAHFDKHKLLTDVNHGFRSGYSCETQLTITIDELAQNTDAGFQTDVAILDFSKAFDTVPHKKLLHKPDSRSERKFTQMDQLLPLSQEYESRYRR